MKKLELSGGTFDYHDARGDGKTLVLLHGLLMDLPLWDTVVARSRRRSPVRRAHTSARCSPSRHAHSRGPVPARRRPPC
jgi:hypothetical protein